MIDQDDEYNPNQSQSNNINDNITTSTTILPQEISSLPNDGNNNNLKSKKSRQLATPALKRGSACMTCRKKKLKCDGVRPTCTTCSRLKHECGYGDPTNDKLLNQITDLSSKVLSLEAELEQFRLAATTSPDSRPPTPVLPYLPMPIRRSTHDSYPSPRDQSRSPAPNSLLQLQQHQSSYRDQSQPPQQQQQHHQNSHSHSHSPYDYNPLSGSSHTSRRESPASFDGSEEGSRYTARPRLHSQPLRTNSPQQSHHHHHSGLNNSRSAEALYPNFVPPQATTTTGGMLLNQNHSHHEHHRQPPSGFSIIGTSALNGNNHGDLNGSYIEPITQVQRPDTSLQILQAHLQSRSSYLTHIADSNGSESMNSSVNNSPVLSHTGLPLPLPPSQLQEAQSPYHYSAPPLNLVNTVPLSHGISQEDISTRTISSKTIAPSTTATAATTTLNSESGVQTIQVNGNDGRLIKGEEVKREIIALVGSYCSAKVARSVLRRHHFEAFKAHTITPAEGEQFDSDEEDVNNEEDNEEEEFNTLAVELRKLLDGIASEEEREETIKSCAKGIDKMGWAWQGIGNRFETLIYEDPSFRMESQPTASSPSIVGRNFYLPW